MSRNVPWSDISVVGTPVEFLATLPPGEFVAFLLYFLDKDGRQTARSGREHQSQDPERDGSHLVPGLVVDGKAGPVDKEAWPLGARLPVVLRVQTQTVGHLCNFVVLILQIIYIFLSVLFRSNY